MANSNSNNNINNSLSLHSGGFPHSLSSNSSSDLLVSYGHSHVVVSLRDIAQLPDSRVLGSGSNVGSDVSAGSNIVGGLFSTINNSGVTASLQSLHGKQHEVQYPSKYLLEFACFVGYEVRANAPVRLIVASGCFTLYFLLLNFPHPGLRWFILADDKSPQGPRRRRYPPLNYLQRFSR
jgi:hypothetical protein